MLDLHVGRQPIYDRSSRVIGYELLFRSRAGAAFASLADDVATSVVIVNAFVEFGREQLVGTATPFVNITRSFAVGDLPLPFPADDAVLELLATVPVDDAVERGVCELVEQGFRLALDDFTWDQRRMPLLPLVSYVKVAATGREPAELAETVRRLHDHGVLTVAEKVETRGDLDACLAAGFDALQGYVLVRPTVVSGRSLPVDRLRALDLLAALSRPETSVREVEAVVRADPALSYRVLRAVRTASVATARRVETVHDALVLLGLDRLRSWVLLMSVAGAGDVDPELLATTAARARFCELMARYWPDVNPATAFLAGMLSRLDLLLGLPMADVVERLPLGPDVTAALLYRRGPLGQLLLAVDGYDTALDVRTGGLPCPLSEMSRAYLASVSWSLGLTHSVLTA